MKEIQVNSLDIIDRWFRSHCDNLWEHQKFRLILQTTDNPGWLVTSDENMEEQEFDKLAQEAYQRWKAECRCES